MLSYFFHDLDAYTFSFLRVANVFVFDLDRIDRLGEVGVVSLDVNNVSNVELATCEFDDAHTKMGIVVGYTTERLFFRLLAPSSSDELYLFERRADMNSGILRNEARQFKNFAVRLSYETVGNFAALHGLPILADVVKAISQFMP